MSHLSLNFIFESGGGTKTGVIITSSRPTDNTTTYKHHLSNKISKNSNADQSKLEKQSSKANSSNISKVNITHNDVVPGQVSYNIR